MNEIVCQVETYVWSSLRESFWTGDPDVKRASNT